MNKLAPKTKIRSIFLCEGKHFYGEIISYQEPSSGLAEGYFIKWKENGYTLFLAKRTVDELYEIYGNEVDEEKYKVNDNGQISFL